MLKPVPVLRGCVTASMCEIVVIYCISHSENSAFDCRAVEVKCGETPNSDGDTVEREDLVTPTVQGDEAGRFGAHSVDRGHCQ